MLAVSHGFVSRLLTTIFGVIAIGFASFGAAVAIGVVTFLKRRRAMHEAPATGVGSDWAETAYHASAQPSRRGSEPAISMPLAPSRRMISALHGPSRSPTVSTG